MGNDLDLALAGLLDHDIVAQVVGAALDLDAVLEELLEGGDVEDLVASGLLSVDDELRATKPRSAFALPSSDFCSFPRLPLPPLARCESDKLEGEREGNRNSVLIKLTFLVCFWALPDFFCCCS